MPDEVSWPPRDGSYWSSSLALKYSDLAGLEHSIDVAYSIASQRLLETFFDKFNLLDHLRALKSYLMLGAGDFTEHLMEALAYVPNYNQSANFQSEIIKTRSKSIPTSPNIRFGNSHPSF
jgi:hypothetical protein